MSIVGKGSQYTSGFSPTSIPGCAMWLDAADASVFTYSSGSNIATWRDKSSNAALTSNVDAGSTYTTDLGRPAVFMPQARMRISNFTMNREHSMFLVTRGSNTTNEFLVANWTTDYLMHFYYGNNAMFFDRTVAFNDASPPIQSDNTQRGLISYTYNRTTFRYRKNGALTSTVVSFGATPTPAGTDTGNFFINGNGSGSFRTNVHVSEIIIFNVALTDAEHQTVEGYLAAKWGIRSRLPNSHMFKSLLPFSRPFVPVDIAGCALWLDAADRTTLTLSGSNVTAWADKSPNSTALTLSNGSGGSAVATTFNGVPVVQFSNSCFFNASYSYPLATRSIFFIVAEVVHSDFRGLVNFANTTGQSDFNTSNGYAITSTATVGSNVEFVQNLGNGGFVYRYNAGTGSVLVPYALYEDVTSNTAVNIYVNGSNAFSTTTVATPATSTGFTVAGRGGVPNTGSLAVAEVLLFNRAISTPERQQVETYLVNKWGLRGLTPAGHYARLAPALSAAFVPTLVPSCALWLDAADTTTITATSGSVTRWNDKVTNGTQFATQGTWVSPTLSQLNGLNVLRFTASAGSGMTLTLNAVTPGTTGFSYFSVFNGTSNSTGNTRIFQGEQRILYLEAGFTTANNVRFFSGSASTATLTASSNVTNMVSITENTSTATVFLNGVQSGATASVNNPTITSMTLGIGPTGVDRFDGSICEYVFFSRTLSISERQIVEGYLANKWRLANNLPNGHPFKTVRP